MAKRKRGKNNSSKDSVRSSVREPGSKLTINSYEDVADSEDEFHINRDKVLLDDRPETKRRKQSGQDDEFMELSDEEVLAYSDAASEEDAEKAEFDGQDSLRKEYNSRRRATPDGSDLDDRDRDEGEGEDEGWGPSKSDYYNADEIETEQDALDEEAEARRIQQKQLSSMKESDFVFDEGEWLQADQGSKRETVYNGHGIVREILPQITVTDQMSDAERLKLLKASYPEFDPLLKELLELQPLYEKLSLQMHPTHNHNMTPSPQRNSWTATFVIKFQALSAYLGALAMYFAILSSTAEVNKTSVPMPPSELREHGIMDSLVQCRGAWLKAENMSEASPAGSPDKSSLLSSDPSESAMQLQNEWMKEVVIDPSPSTTLRLSDSAKAAPQLRRKERSRRTEESLAALSSLIERSARHPPPSRLGAPAYRTSQMAPADDLDSDIGDEPTLAPHEMAEKAHRKKSLRFYTSQIAQKANKRANASRSTGGDDDLPYRERFRDRQIRLNEQAEKRGEGGRRQDGMSDDDGEEETNLQRESREDEAGTPGDQYTQWLDERTQANKARRQAEKRRRAEAYAAEHGGAVVEHETEKIGVDGRRQIGYTIEKNKGLTPRRKKEVKNPRVKKRMRYEDKKKKLGSMRQVYKGGEGKGGYGGELTGIKKGLVRSVKL